MSSPLTSRSGLSIRSRTILGYSLVLALMLIASGIALVHMSSMEKLTDSITTGSQEMYRLAAIRTRWHNLVATLNEMLLTRQRTMAGEEVSDAFESLLEGVDSLQAVSSYAGVDMLRSCLDEVSPVVDSIRAASHRGSWAMAQIVLHTDLASLQRRVEGRLLDMQDSTARRVMREIERAETTQHHARASLLFIVALSLILGPLAAALTASSVIRPIEYLAREVRGLGPEGLQHKLEESRGDEIGQLAAAYNTMTDRLSQVLGGLEDQLEAYRRVQIALQESEDRYKSLFQHSPISLWELDLTGLKALMEELRTNAGSNVLEDPRILDPIRIVDVNRATAGLLGLSGDESPGELGRFLTQGMRRALVQALKTFAAGGTVYTSEAELLDCDGAARNVIAHFAVPPESHTSFSKVFVSLLDITERKKMEKALRESEEQYYQAQKMEAVGRLTGGVAHDFNNLLTVIINNCDIALAEPDMPREARRRLDQVSRAASRAASVIEQLLAFSHQQVSNPVPVSPNILVSSVSEMLEHIIGEDVELITDLSEDLPSLAVDPGHIEQVILNMAVNARDAMPRGGKLTISTYAERLGPEDCSGSMLARPGSYVVISVADTGFGMEPEVMEKAFEPFFTTKERGKGTGLGLASAHGIVTDSGGWIDVRSDPGRGTTFRIYLPAVADSASGEGEAVSSDQVQRGTGTVLLLEDEEGVREVLARGLSLGGYAVLEASDGRQAIELFEEHGRRIDLLVSDVVLPGDLNGIQVARRLREIDPGLGILVMSGYARDAIAQSGRLPQGVAFLQKPFTMSAFIEQVRNAIR